MSRRQETVSRPSGTAGKYPHQDVRAQKPKAHSNLTSGIGRDAGEQKLVDQYFRTKKGPGSRMKVPQTHQRRVNANGRIVKPNVAPSHQKPLNSSAFTSIMHSRRVSVSEYDFYKSEDIVGNWMANQLSSEYLDTPGIHDEFSNGCHHHGPYRCHAHFQERTRSRDRCRRIHR